MRLDFHLTIYLTLLINTYLWMKYDNKPALHHVIREGLEIQKARPALPDGLFNDNFIEELIDELHRSSVC